jgi:hypothetical protein
MMRVSNSPARTGCGNGAVVACRVAAVEAQPPRTGLVTSYAAQNSRWWRSITYKAMHGTVQRWIESGQQIGKSIVTNRDGQACYISVAIQKWESIYKVSVTEIRESNMTAELFDRDEVRSFKTFKEVAAFFEHNSPIALIELMPLKGQKLSNPGFQELP